MSQYNEFYLDLQTKCHKSVNPRPLLYLRNVIYELSPNNLEDFGRMASLSLHWPSVWRGRAGRSLFGFLLLQGQTAIGQFPLDSRWTEFGILTDKQRKKKFDVMFHERILAYDFSIHWWLKNMNLIRPIIHWNFFPVFISLFQNLTWLQ